MGGVGGQPSPVERYGLDIERLVVWRQRPRWIELVRPDPGYASEEHDRQQRKGPGDKFDLAGLDEARLVVSPRVRPSVPPSEYERRERRRNDDREHDDERSDQERRRRLADDSFGMEEDELLAPPQRERCEHGSAAESDGGRRSTFEPGARPQRLDREGL